MIASATERWLPPGIRRTWHAVRRQLTLDRASRQLLRDNRALRGRHAGQRAFILCSGPSIKTQNLAVLRGEVCIGVSNFFVHPDYATIAPRYHCIAPLHPPFTDADGLRWFREMDAPLAGRELFLGLSDRRLTESGGVFRATQVHYLALGQTSLERRGTGIAMDGLLPATQSVSIMALLVAVELGFAEIYLLGTDHTSLNFQTGQYGYNHFYSGTRHNALGEMPPPRDLETEFAGYVTLWRQYKALRQIADTRGIRIFNATRGGMLDVFPRVDLESLFPSTPAARENPSP